MYNADSIAKEAAWARRAFLEKLDAAKRIGKIE